MRNWFVFTVVCCLFLANGFGQKNRFESVFKQVDSLPERSQQIKKLQTLRSTHTLNKIEKTQFYERLIPLCIENQQYDLSLQYAFEASKFAEAIKDDSLQACFTNQIAGSYYYIQDKKQAQLYFEKANRIAATNHYWELEAKTASNLGALSVENRRFDVAERYLTRAIRLFKAHNRDLSDGIMCYRLLATSYTDAGKFEKAEPIFKEVISRAKQNRDSSNMTSGLIYYAEYLSQQGQKLKALQLSEEALSIQRKLHDKNALANVLSFIGTQYSRLGKHEAAAKAFSELVDLNKQIFKKNLEENISKVEVKYKTAEITRLKELAESKALAETRKNDLYLIVFVLVLLFLCIVFLLFFLRLQSKKRQVEIAIQKQHVEAIIEAQEKEKVRIAQDLHDGICQKFAATKLKFNTISDGILDQIPDIAVNYKDCINLLDEATNELRLIAHEIMPPALHKFGLVDAVKFLADQTFGGRVKHTFEIFGTTERLSEHQEINMYRIAQELISNVMKHAQATEVSVQFVFSLKQVLFVLEDNGNGFTKGSSTGMGLGNIHLRTEIMNAKFNIEPSANGGTFASVTITK